MNILHSSKSVEWYTPEWLVELIRTTMGGEIHLDPASNAKANAIVKAENYHTLADGGLDKIWYGNTFLNPPYGKQTGDWVRRWCEARRKEEFVQSVLLVNATTDRSWFRPLWDSNLCFLYNRVRFWSPDGNFDNPTHGSVIVYHGDNIGEFQRQFGDRGKVVIPWGSHAVAFPDSGQSGIKKELKKGGTIRKSLHTARRERMARNGTLSIVPTVAEETAPRNGIERRGACVSNEGPKDGS